MSMVITFSRTFPGYHPKAGQPTHFVGKIWESIYMKYPEWLGENCSDVKHLYPQIGLHGILNAKHHTIRAGNRFNVGDKFSPRVWSGKPYNSKQIIIAPDLEVKKVWKFQIANGAFVLDGRIFDGEIESHHELLELIALNDGLTKSDFLSWFKYPKPFDGQVICWDENVKY